jgi:hypothetical protein
LVSGVQPTLGHGALPVRPVLKAWPALRPLAALRQPQALYGLPVRGCHYPFPIERDL